MRKKREGDKQPEKKLGVQCPSCGCRHHHVLVSKAVGKTVRRSRECRNCGRWFTTTERADSTGDAA